MDVAWPVVVIIGMALAVYSALRSRERRTSQRAARISATIAALGDDAVPSSLHPVVDLDVCIGSGGCVRACPEKDVLGIIGGQAHLVNPLACVGHGTCLTACPVEAIRLVFGTAAHGVELPVHGPDFQTSQPGVYVVGELAGMGLIRNAVEQGLQVARSIVPAGRRGPRDTLDAVVVGAGPGGIGATLGLRQRGLRVVLLEQDTFGGSVRHYPRGKVVLTGSIELPGYGRLRRRTMKKEELERTLDDVRDTTTLPLETGVCVDALRRDGDTWVVGAGDRAWRAANVILALGRRGAPRKLGVPGEDQPHVHYRVLETEPFIAKHVLVVGGGSSAAECALALADSGRCATVALSYRRSSLARVQGEVRQRLEEAFASGRVAALLGTRIETIAERDVSLAFVDGRRERRRADSVIVQIGGTVPEELLARLGIAMVTKRGEP